MYIYLYYFDVEYFCIFPRGIPITSARDVEKPVKYVPCTYVGQALFEVQIGFEIKLR